MKRAVEKNERMCRVLESAARFQTLVPDAVLVGGTAVSAHLGHRESLDHDHVLTDLEERFVEIFELLSAQAEWQTAHVRDGKIILGTFGGVEAGLRQLRRERPLETELVLLESGATVRVPTLPEMTRVKAFLITNRNQTRDYLDFAALAERMGIGSAAQILLEMDAYYEKCLSSSGSVGAELLIMLGSPSPDDADATRELLRYKGLDARYHDWNVVVKICRQVAEAMLKGGQEC